MRAPNGGRFTVSRYFFSTISPLFSSFPSICSCLMSGFETSPVPQYFLARSEERRVGKECRFQCYAEDGIRDWSVTGVQTCALPICVKKRQKQQTPGPI